MLVKDLSRTECDEVLARASIARIACVHDGQPYVVPIHVVFDGYHLYGLSTVGRKIEWMRAHSRVCVEIDEIEDPSRWTTVLVFGDYEELPAGADDTARTWAERLLAPRAKFWLPALARSGSHDAVTPVVYRIRIARVTGRTLRKTE